MISINTQKPHGLLLAFDKLAKLANIIGLLCLFVMIPNVFSATPLFEFQMSLGFLLAGMTVFTIKKWGQVVFHTHALQARHINFAFALTYSSATMLIGVLCAMCFQTPDAVGLFFGKDILEYYSFASIAMLVLLLVLSPTMYFYLRSVLIKERSLTGYKIKN